MKSFTTLSLAVMFFLSHLSFLTLWAVAFDGCTKCLYDAEKHRLSLIVNLSWLHGIKFAIDVILFSIALLILTYKRKIKYSMPLMMAGFVLYVISSIDFWGASIYSALTCGSDCDSMTSMSIYFEFFGYLAIPLFLGAFSLMFFSLKTKPEKI